MGNVKLPSRICGEWIWKKVLLHQQDSFLLMRREFVCSSVGQETNLWISANSAYQLFINGTRTPEPAISTSTTSPTTWSRESM